MVLRGVRVTWIFVLAGALAGPVAGQSAAPQPTPSRAPAAAGTDDPAALEVVTRDATGHVTVRAVRIPEPVVVDGRLDDSIYGRVPAISDFVQQEPVEGQPATEKTEVWLLFDDRTIYVSARCWDSHPERIVANEMRRDNFNIFQNDNFAVIFDTFHDRRNGAFFHLNPLGGLFDGLVTDERNVNRDWNTVWDAKTGRFAQGWTVEIAIPFKSLRYQEGRAQTWGVNFRRIVRWKNEHSFLSQVPASIGPRGLTQLSSAATLVGLEAPGGTKNLELKPYVTSGLLTDRTATPVVRNDWTRDAGFDVKYGLTQGLTLDFTVNTDFAQVEDDEQQVNLTRFSLFFPEKREFFLEGQGIFEFGGAQSGRRMMGGPPSNTPIIFFSRRIGLTGAGTVPLRAGARVTGRVGKYSVGLLNIQTGADRARDAAATNFSVVRVKRDILRRSTVGVIATRRGPDIDGSGTNAVYGVDLGLAFYRALSINSFYVRSDTPDRPGEEASYRAQLDYNGDRYGVEVDHLTVEADFNPEVGFLRRRDLHRNYAKLRFSPRPESIEAIRKLTHEASLEHITNSASQLETRIGELRFQMELESGDDWELTFTDNYELLNEPFDIAEDVTIPVGGYAFQEVRGQFQLGPQRRVAGRLSASHGSFFGGTRTEAEYGGRAELTPQFTIEPRISVNWVDLPWGSFTTTLLSQRVNYTLSPRSFLGALVQYNSSAQSFSTNLRFRWEYRPGSDLFVVYNEGRETLLRGFPRLGNRTFIVKLTRLIRF